MCTSDFQSASSNSVIVITLAAILSNRFQITNNSRQIVVFVMRIPQTKPILGLFESRTINCIAAVRIRAKQQHASGKFIANTST